MIVLLVLITAGLATIIGLWLREGSIFPGDRTERIHREILDEIDARLKKFESTVVEARKIELKLNETVHLAAKLAGMASALSAASGFAGTAADKESAKPPTTLNDPTLTNSQRERLKSLEEQSADPAAADIAGELDDGPSAEYAEKALKALEMTRKGKSNAEIASRLGLGVGEVELILSLVKDAAGFKKAP
ncbi:MAG: hypothetical protein HRF49_07110 [bacterium]